MVDFVFESPKYVVAKHVHKNNEPIHNARWIIDESRISNGSIFDIAMFLSNDPINTDINDRLWVRQTSNNSSVTFPKTSNNDCLYGKLVAKAGVVIDIDDSDGKSQPLEIAYND